MIENNILAMTDSYKFTHWRQYPPRTQKIYSYFESRGGEFDETIFFGLQYFLKKYLSGQVVTDERIMEAAALVDQHIGPGHFNGEGWAHILNDHGGKLPISIRAVPEGTPVPTHNVLMTVENTCPKCFWLTNYLETLLVQTWYPTTVATLSKEIRKVILDYLVQTGDPSLIDFKLHDFGFRGVSSPESAGLGGMAHLVNFKGTDTVQALIYARNYYDAGMPGFSIPAAEHSTITTWHDEKAAFRNMLEQFPTGLVAVVSDSYDIYNACKNIWGDELKARVLEREGTLVIRPDSGEPEEVVIKCLDILSKSLGFERNAKGYMVLNPKVRIIQGDGVNIDSIMLILQHMKRHGYSADNIAFGMGGALLQKLNRDTQKFAFKCSHAVVDSVGREVYKDPITDPGKKSKRGRLSLRRDSMGFHTEVETTNGENYLREVFHNGECHNLSTFDEVRTRANGEVGSPVGAV